MHKRLISFLVVLSICVCSVSPVSADRWLVRGRCSQTWDNSSSEGDTGSQAKTFYDDFEDGIDSGWIKDGKISATLSAVDENNQVAAIDMRGSLTYNEPLKNFTVETDVVYTGYTKPNGFLEWSFRPRNGLERYYVFMNCLPEGSGGYFSIRKLVNDEEVILAQQGYSLTLNKKYHIKIECKDNTINLYVDGALFLNSVDENLTEAGPVRIGSAGFGADVNVQIDNVKIEEIPFQNIKYASLDSPDLTLAVGEKLRLPMNIEPFDASDKSLTLKTSDSKVIGLGDYTIEGLSPGTATVTAVTNNGGYVLKYNVTVTTPTFEDVRSSGCRAYVEELLRDKILDLEAGEYRPYDLLTRAEAVDFMVGIIGYDKLKRSEVYTDSVSHTFADSLRTAKKAGLVPESMVTDGAFRPDNRITVGELAELLVSAYKLATGKAAEGDTLQAAVELKMLTSSDVRNPSGTVKREDMARIAVAVKNVLDKAGRLPVVPLDIEIDLPRETGGEVVNILDFGAQTFDPEDPNSPRFDNYEAFNKAIAYCKSVGARKLIFPKGKYYFCTKRMEIKGMTDFEIDAQGSELINGVVAQFMNFSGNTRFAFRNAVVDYDWEKDRIAELIQIKEKNGDYVELEFLSRDEVKLEDVPRILGINTGGIMVKDKETFGWALEDDMDISKEFNYTDLQKTGANTVSCTLTRENTYNTIEKGDLFLRNYYSYQGHTFLASDNKHFTIDNIKMYGGIGHGYSFSGHNEYYQIINCEIGLRPGYEIKHPISTATDGIHISKSDGHYKIENNVIGYQGDDGMNIYEKFTSGIRYDDGDPYSLIAVGANWAVTHVAGDDIEVLNPDWTQTGFRARPVEVIYDDPAQEIRFVFDKKVPVNMPSTSIILNRSFHNHWGIIRGNKFHHNRARGLLLKGEHVLVENNTFEDNQSSAVKIETNVPWGEGTESRDMWFRNNTINNVDIGRWEGTDIVVDSIFRNKRTATPVNTNLLFENNTFINTKGNLFKLSGFDGITIRNNEIQGLRPTTLPELPGRGSIFAEMGKNLHVYGNVYEQSDLLSDRLLNVDGNTVSGVVGE